MSELQKDSLAAIAGLVIVTAGCLFGSDIIGRACSALGWG